MHIQYRISGEEMTIGSFADEYADRLMDELESAFPGSSVDVSFTSRFSNAGEIIISGTSEEYEAEVRRIAARLWESMT